jgi:fission 1 protein
MSNALFLFSLYYLSLGSFKLEKYSAARDYVNSLLQVDPHNQQATRLKDLIAEKVSCSPF